MENPFLLCSLTIAMSVVFCLSGYNLVLSADATESPGYTALHSESDFEIRLYNESSWMCAQVHGTSFEQSTKDGFHRLYQYIHGANLNSTELEKTVPVLTSITSLSSESVYFVRYYLPSEHQKNPPQPSPELNLQLEKWKSHCVAIRKFSGFAKDTNIDKEKKALVSSLGKHFSRDVTTPGNKNTYTIAQYNAPTFETGRLNEVWMDVSGVSAEGCSPHQGKY